MPPLTESELEDDNGWGSEVDAIVEKTDEIKVYWIEVNVRNALEHRDGYSSMRTTTIGTARIITNKSNLPISGMGRMCAEVLGWRCQGDGGD